MKLRYLKIDEILVSDTFPASIYMSDVSQYVPKEYSIIKFYFLKKQLFD